MAKKKTTKKYKKPISQRIDNIVKGVLGVGGALAVINAVDEGDIGTSRISDGIMARDVRATLEAAKESPNAIRRTDLWLGALVVPIYIAGKALFYKATSMFR